MIPFPLWSLTGYKTTFKIRPHAQQKTKEMNSITFWVFPSPLHRYSFWFCVTIGYPCENVSVWLCMFPGHYLWLQPLWTLYFLDSRNFLTRFTLYRNLSANSVYISQPLKMFKHIGGKVRSFIYLNTSTFFCPYL